MENTTDTLQTKITEARNLLSKESREAIDNVNWKLTILGMDKKYNSEQLENLETETELLLCGILNPEDYPVELQNRMQITKGEVGLLINEMDKLVFKKIQEDLEKRLTGKDKTITPTVTAKSLDFDPRFMSMPKEMEEAVAKSNWKEKLYEIAPKYKLNIEQMGILEEMTVKVISNEIHPDKYEEELASKITIAKEDISNLVKDVNEEILKKIREEENSSKEQIVSDMDEEVPVPPYAKVKEKIVEIPKNIIEDKLQGATVSTRTVSDHTTPKISDPYREEF